MSCRYIGVCRISIVVELVILTVSCGFIVFELVVFGVYCLSIDVDLEIFRVCC